MSACLCASASVKPGWLGSGDNPDARLADPSTERQVFNEKAEVSAQREACKKMIGVLSKAMAVSPADCIPSSVCLAPYPSPSACNKIFDSSSRPPARLSDQRPHVAHAESLLARYLDIRCSPPPSAALPCPGPVFVCLSFIGKPLQLKALGGAAGVLAGSQ